MNTIARFLRWLADKCGGETDLDLRARALGIMRNGRPYNGTRGSIERAILDATAVPVAVRFDWSRDGRDEVLTARFSR